MTDDDRVDLLARYGTLEGLDLPTLAVARLGRPQGKFVPWERSDELATILADYEAGWMACRSGVLWFAPGRPPSVEPSSLGPILVAELSAGDRSLHVHYDGATNGWRVATLEEQDDGPSLLAEDVAYLVEMGSGAESRLRYRRYWDVADGAMRPVLARFIGFGEDV
jgi:hypothetical protein